VCNKHGATKKLCNRDGCSNKATNGGVCIKHGAKCKICSNNGCTNKAINGGVCHKHGAKRKRCSRLGCTSFVKKGGVCIRHGAEVKVKKCNHEDCTKRAINGGVCKRHGAEVKICNHEDCPNKVRQGGVCKRHGTTKNTRGKRRKEVPSNERVSKKHRFVPGAKTEVTTATRGAKRKHCFVKLCRGTTQKLLMAAEVAVQSGEGESVVNCEDEHYEGLDLECQQQLYTMGKDTFHDKCRKQFSLKCPDGGVKDSIQTVLQREISGGNVLTRGSVLVTSNLGEITPLRQQLHWDFGKELRTCRNRFFVLIPVDNNQTIYVCDGGKLSKLRLKKDWAFVGDADLLHCGSETPGRRVHFEFIPEGEKNNSKEVFTYFATDHYPRK